MSQNVNEPLNPIPWVHCSPEVLTDVMRKAQEILAAGGEYRVVFEDPVVLDNSTLGIGVKAERTC